MVALQTKQLFVLLKYINKIILSVDSGPLKLITDTKLSITFHQLFLRCRYNLFICTYPLKLPVLPVVLWLHQDD